MSAGIVGVPSQIAMGIQVKAAAQAKKVAAGLKGTQPVLTKSPNPVGITFNLPPCSASLPLTIGKQGLPIGDKTANIPDTTRLSSMWFLDQAGAGQAATKNSGAVKPSAPNSNFAYGFQWLWNPDKVATSVQQNSNVVPNQMDATSPQNGLFPGLEQVTVSARVNRIVDMAMIRGGQNMSYSYYTKGRYVGDIDKQIKLLSEKGTMADIEHIFRMCNGVNDGAGKPHTNVFGIQTADTAYLTPTTVALKIGNGPLIYSGWLASMTIAHTMFTWDMVPIDTTIDFTINTFSTTAFVN